MHTLDEAVAQLAECAYTHGGHPPPALQVTVTVWRHFKGTGCLA